MLICMRRVTFCSVGRSMALKVCGGRPGLEHRTIYVGLVLKKSGIESGGFFRIFRVSFAIDRYLFMYFSITNAI
jgi:hypothetical protein